MKDKMKQIVNMKGLLAGCVLLLMGVTSVQGQTHELDLKQLIESLHNNHPLTERTDIYQKQEKLDAALLDKQWLPKVNLQGQATWQSEVTGIEMDVSIPGVDLSIPEAPKDQYKVALELQQTLYDGGRTKLSRQLETSQYEGQRHAHEMDLHTLEQQVTTLYFAGLQIHYQHQQIALKANELDSRLKQLESAVAHGALLPSELHTLQAEKLKLEQQILQLEAKQKGLYDQLSLLTGVPVDEQAEFTTPVVSYQQQTNWQRPVFDYLKSQQGQLTAQQQLTKAANRPQIFGFAQAGYGKPGLNMLSDQFSDYYMVGVKLSWQLWDWQKGETQRALLAQQSKLVDLSQQDIKLKFQQQLADKRADINRLENALEKDDEIIALRKSIYNAAKAKLQNGTITATDYLSELNAVADAQLAKDLRELSLAKNKVEYLQVMGVPLSEVLMNK
jgi:outer membrane protein TolC